MRQVVQFPATGEARLVDVPEPSPRRGSMVVRTVFSAMSVGTERSMLEFGARSLLGKAFARPDLLRRVLQVARTEGPGEAYRQARGRLDTFRPLGYSSAGMVIDVGDGVMGFARGDRVACMGSGVACHAELVSVTSAQAVRLPAEAGFDGGALAALGAIAVHNLSLARVGPGSTVAVIGLGLLGLLAVQVARARGCVVFATDVDPARVTIARALGSELALPSDAPGLVSGARAALGGGADAVLIFAATPSNGPLELAADLARFRGRVVATGVVGLTVPRRAFYENELSLVVAKDWGAPGEAKRNAETFIALLAAGSIRTEALITHRFPIDRAKEAYDLIVGKGRERPLGVLLSYEAGDTPAERPPRGMGTSTRPGVGISLIGAGTFARATILPIVRALPGVRLRGVASATGGSAEHAARAFGFRYATTDVERVLADPDTSAVIIATRHDLHAALVARALEAGKRVFVEKPLALSIAELARVVAAQRRSAGAVMVGFNRRFAPATRSVQALLDGAAGPTVIDCRANVGRSAATSWIYDPVEGGGRVLGEICHFVDLVCALVDAEPVVVTATAVRGHADVRADENVVLTIAWADGSIGTIVYTALGDRAYSRERLEAFRGGAAASIENFRTVTVVRGGRTRRIGRWSVDRGHRAQFAEFAGALAEERAPGVSFEAYVQSSLVALAADEAVRSGEPVDVATLRKAMEALCVS